MACSFQTARGGIVNYTRTPDAQYPQAINGIYAATKWVSEPGPQSNDLVLQLRRHNINKVSQAG